MNSPHLLVDHHDDSVGVAMLTAREMGEHVDLDVSGILRPELTMDDAGKQLIDITLRTCKGRLTAAEALGHRGRNDQALSKRLRTKL